ncbi:MAG: hypothetical protein KatS3mg018_2219 [Fimbriimonadales bacterium]|nr:MAG: hypothetical protein KatS3mg018_2219 [Fimbriimonadales bacterium]
MSQMSGLKTNLDYWKISLANPEPDLPEEFYIHDELIIEDEKYLQAVSRLIPTAQSKFANRRRL